MGIFPIYYAMLTNLPLHGRSNKQQAASNKTQNTGSISGLDD